MRKKTSFKSENPITSNINEASSPLSPPFKPSHNNRRRSVLSINQIMTRDEEPISPGIIENQKYINKLK